MLKKLTVAAISMVCFQTAVAQDNTHRQVFRCPASGCKVQCTGTPQQSPMSFAASNRLELVVTPGNIGLYHADNGARGKQTVSVNLNERACMVDWD